MHSLTLISSRNRKLEKSQFSEDYFRLDLQDENSPELDPNL